MMTAHLLRNTPLEDQLTEARQTYAQRRPKSAEAHASASVHLPGGNTRTVLYHGPFPLRAERGEGAYLYDVDGRKYLNLLGEYTAGVFGHSHPVIQAAVHQALSGGVNLGAHSKAEVQLADLVCERFPALEKVRFTNSGTEANLMAVSTARHVTKRSKVMVFRGGYHGGLLYFGAKPDGGAGIPINAPFEYVIAPFNDMDATRDLIRQSGLELSCVLMEPMLGSSGCIPATPEFLSMVREETKACGALLIFDEVMTSRFGANGAGALYGVTPDLMTLGKWVGGGMSFGAFGGRDDIMAIYDPTRIDAMPHAGTFNNNALTMNAGVAALSEIFRSEEAEGLHERGNRLRNRLNSLFAEHDVAMCVSGEGSLMNVHGFAGPVKQVDDLARSRDELKELLFLDLLEQGFYIARRGFIALSIVVTDQELDAFVTAVETSVLRYKSVLPPRL